MCGICGIYQYGDGKPVDEKLINNMIEVIHHRGPDDKGLYVDDDLALGICRLSIIDLVGGNQPIYNGDGSIVVIFNGEIYNYQELTDRLRKRGHVFVTASDTEVIVHLYEELGEDCVHELRGMFAFAVWDTCKRRLFLARDRLGIKPLYYAHKGRSLVFGSEIKALLEYRGLQRSMDLASLSDYLSLKYVPAPRTMFSEIFALPPGHTLTCDPNGVFIKMYWDLSFSNNQNGEKSEEAYAEQLEGLLKESVKMRLISDVPFGAFLSGGIDSSTIVALMSQYLQEPVKTFSVGFEGDGHSFSELPYARLVAKHYQTDHHEIIVRPRDFIDYAEKIAWHLDQPLADEVAFANYMVAKLASSHVKMVLTGEGGDELFAGYARYAGEQFSPFFQFIPEYIKSQSLKLINGLPGLRRPKVAMYALCQADEVTRLTNWFPLFNYNMKLALLSNEVKRELGEISANHVFAEHLSRTNTSNRLSRMLYVDTKLWLPDDLLARGDKMSMAVSLEARVPFLDHKLVEFAASLPQHLKLKRLTRKYLLKKISRALLPAKIVNRKKKGFPVPVSMWLRKEARPFLREVLSPAVIRRRGLFNRDYVEKLLQQHEEGVADHGSLLFGLLSVELWHHLFID